MFKDMRRNLGRDFFFNLGLPEFKPDLSDIYPCYNNIVVLDDLMDMAVDSSIISKLFTQWKHSNARVILLLQNAFSKGKYNTSISCNAQYMTHFRCLADRGKQESWWIEFLTRTNQHLWIFTTSLRLNLISML